MGKKASKITRRKWMEEILSYCTKKFFLWNPLIRNCNLWKTIRPWKTNNCFNVSHYVAISSWIFFSTDDRSSRSQMLFKIVIPKKFRNIHRKTPVLEVLLNNVSGLQASNFIKRENNTGVFLWILKNFLE